jgi:hypothetical protein
MNDSPARHKSTGKVWVLDTDTKGTGARMVPLEDTLEKPAPSNEPFFVPIKRQPKPPEEPTPRPPRTFRVLDLMTRQVLAEDADARATLEVLRNVRSVVDVRVHTRDDEGRWRPLTLAEQRALWELRGRS